MYFFLVFLISITLLGSVTVGPFSIRVYSTVMMFAYLLYSCNSCKYVQIDRSFLKTYVVFLVLMGFSQFLINEIMEYEYFKKLLAYHFVCIVAFWAIERYINNRKELSKAILVLTAVMLFNNVITILQFLGNDIGWSIGMLFGDIQNNMDFADSHDSLLGYSRTPGIFGNVVNNAFAIAVLCPLSLCFFNNGIKTMLKVVVSASMVIALVACFMTQQRAAFGLMLFCVCLCLYVEFRKNVVLFIFTCILVFIFGSDLNISEIDMGRFADASNDSRNNFYKLAIIFISENPIFGGPIAYQRLTYGYTSHNVILDSWIAAGLFGFAAMMSLFVKTIWTGVKTLYKGVVTYNQDRFMIFCSLAVLNAMFYGLTHNTSYLAGNVINFIVLALMLKIISISRSFTGNDASQI